MHTFQLQTAGKFFMLKLLATSRRTLAVEIYQKASCGNSSRALCSGSEQYVHLERLEGCDGISEIRLDRPKARNAIGALLPQTFILTLAGHSQVIAFKSQ